MISYLNGNFVPKGQALISPEDRGFMFADGVYEMLRTYGGTLFKPDEHLRRLERSLQEVRIAGVDVESIRDAAEELLQRNGMKAGEASVYVQVTRGAAPRKHAFPNPGVAPTVYLSTAALHTSPKEFEAGIKVMLVPDTRWARCDIKAVALLPNVLANQRAKENGAEEAVFVRDGAVTEGSHSNFCAVFDGELHTYPKCNYILAGITRDTVLDLCRSLGIRVVEYPVLEQELRKADELMVLGTTTEVMPVVRVDDWQVRDGKPGPVARRLQKAFLELAHRT
ncbi:MAG: D-amino-acid transaminase [Chloroflexi bacterium]|nr:D-amino-acid transaminase [Chloroflexota bacterium]